MQDYTGLHRALEKIKCEWPNDGVIEWLTDQDHESLSPLRIRHDQWPCYEIFGRPLTEVDLWRKTTFDGGRPVMEDDLWWKTNFDGRRPLTEDGLWWKTPLMEDDLRWKTTLNGRRPLIGLQYITWKFSIPHLDIHSTTDTKQEILSAV